MKNYYVYVPVAYYLYHAKHKFVQYRWLFLIGFGLSIIAEWTFIGMTAAYGRLPIFLGTLSFVSFFISGWTAASRPITLLSRYSLGIFALHGYCFAAVLVPYAMLLRRQDRVLPIQTFPEGVLLFVVIFALTCLCIWLMTKTKLRMYVS